MKSCKNCKNYDLDYKYCFAFHIKIIDDVSAEVCKFYKEKKKVPENIKCVNCMNLNKYGYCSVKKKCKNEDEKFKEHKCSQFKIRLNRKKRKKY